MYKILEVNQNDRVLDATCGSGGFLVNTGRGDTTFGAYLAKRMMGVSIPDALLFATAAVSLKMESPGPLQGPEQAVLDYIKEFYA